MKTKYDPDFIRNLKKLNARIRKNFKERISIFQKHPHDPQLNNHPLKDMWLGYRSINITADWRAIYKEINEENDEPIAYFTTIGTHEGVLALHLFSKNQK